MDKEEIKKIFGLVLVDHNPEEFFKHCTDDFKLILHPNPIPSGLSDNQNIYNLFDHFSTSFPNWPHHINTLYHAT